MEASQRKPFILQSVKTGVFSLVFACIGVLVLALIAKLCNLPDTVLPIINQVIKAVAVAVGVAVCVKEEKFLFKALVGAVIYWVLSFVMFSLIGGQFHWGQIFLDLGIAVAVSVIVALIKSRKA